MLNSYLRWALVLTCATTLAACGDDDGAGPVGDQLTETETQALAQVVLNLGLTIFNSTDPASSVVAAHSLDGGFPEQTITFDQEAYDCPEGGQVVVDGSMTVDSETDGESGTFDMNIQQVHDDCVATATNGQTFTLNASPNITTTFDGDFSPTATNVAGEWTGGIGWTSGTRSGTCSIDFQIDVSISESGGASGTVGGTMCGQSITAAQ